jgi:hypothetical protein
MKLSVRSLLLAGGVLPYASPHLHLILPRNKRIITSAVGFRIESSALVLDS